MSDDSPDTDALLARAAAGDVAAWGGLLAGHQERLARIVAFRLDPRLRGRLDAADVVQEAFADASSHPADYFNLPPPVPPLFLWLRGVVGNKLLELHRHHLGTHKRDADRDRPLDGHAAPGAGPGDTGAALCAHLTAGLTRPSVAAERGEVRTRVAEALRAMDPTDREVLAMRHFEQLTTAETAQVLGIQQPAAAKRYLRAIQRLKEILSEMPGGLTELRP